MGTNSKIENITNKLNNLGFNIKPQSEPKESTPPSSPSNTNTTDTITIEEKYEECRALMAKCEGARGEEIEKILEEAAGKIINVLIESPQHVPSLYLLGVVCFSLNDFESALEVLEEGEMLDADYEPIQVLISEISRMLLTMEGGYCEEGEEGSGSGTGKRTRSRKPLMCDGELSQDCIMALSEIFTEFDVDEDNCLSVEEFTNLAQVTAIYNHSEQQPPPPAEMVNQLFSHFDCDDGKITHQGFLEFYHQQTLGEPEETANDLRAHGYKQFGMADLDDLQDDDLQDGE
eukprot:Nk52_evm1s58 gene=Nk52_evmTU1s58